ncbi:MAG: Ig-like domain-containing protein [Verrucomicrobia bacterium]|nr:Ig-like domain-containing protein [Verrucomicrobiota bacterium]
MRKYSSATLLLVTFLCLSTLAAKAADVLTPGFLKLSLYTNITGAAVADFTADAKYPKNPNDLRFLRSFNTRDALPNDTLQDFGGRIEGFLTPLESGQYHFFLRSDSQSQLWLGTDETEASAAQIAEETDRGDPFMEPDAGDAATSGPVDLTAGKRYFIMVLYKGNSGGGNSTDFAQAAWRKVGDSTPAASLKPIPGAFLSTLASDAQGPKITITQPPKDVTGEENSAVTFTVTATPVPASPVSIQWQRNGVNLPGAVGNSYTRFLDKADNAAKFRAVVSVPGASLSSAEATATVSDDKTAPTILRAKGGPNRPEVTLMFSERVSSATATATANYKITGPTGATLGVTGAELSADRTQVILKTEAQTVGAQYTVNVNNVTDLAASAPNKIAANAQATFYALGPWLQGEDGFVVWEAEDFDRNLDGLWTVDTERGVASGGVSMVNLNGAGGSENATKLEYDIFFTKTGTNILWWRFSGNDGNDDSFILHLDGARPVGRETGNLAAMSGTGSSLAANWGWTANPFEGGGQMTFVIDTPGVHTIGIARREDGSYLDKLVITTSPGFNPTTGFGTFGPPVTFRQGEPPPAAAANFEIAAQPQNSQGQENAPFTIVASAAIPQGFLFSYQWQRKQGNAFADIPGAAFTNLTVNPLTMDWNGAMLRLKVVVAGVVKYSNEATLTVVPDTTPPALLRASGLAASQEVTLLFSEPLNAATAQSLANYKIDGPAGSLAVQTVTVMPSGLLVLLNTGPQTAGTKYTVSVSGVTDRAAKANVIAGGQAKFYSLGDRLAQTADGQLVFEAESYDRNTDDRWIIDRTRGTPSSGASVVLPNGAGGDENSKLEYDLNFTKTGTHVIWYRARGDSGSDDSGWIHIDGGRPANRTAGNTAAMTGFDVGVNGDFVWRSNPFEGGGQMTFDIPTAGPHVFAVARREDGSFFDKFVITTNLTFNPDDFGPFGPPETRTGAPSLPTLAITSPAPNARLPESANVEFKVDISATTRVISKVEFFQGITKIGESTASPFSFTLQKAPTGVYNASALLTDDVGDSVRARPVLFVVGEPNDVVLLVGNPNVAAGSGDALVRDRLASFGFNVVIVDDTLSQESDAFGRKLVVNSSSVDSGAIAAKFRNVTIPVVSWEQANQDDFAMTGDTATDRGTVTNQTQIAILDTTHPLAGGFKAGPLTVAASPTEVGWGLPAASATRIATVVGNADQAAIYGYDKGAAMMGGFTAPARRVHFFTTDASFPLLNADGLKLFDAALSWALERSVTPPAGGISVTVSVGAGGLTLKWAGGTGPYTIQSKASLSDAAWSDVLTTSDTSATVPIQGAAGFFRIRAP